MTPAIRFLRDAGVSFRLHEYAHDPRSTSWAGEAAKVLGLAPETVFKTLVVSLGAGELALAIVPASARLDPKALARAAGAKRAELASPREAEKATGYVLGGISPFGARRRLPTFLDQSALAHPEVFVSGGRRGLDVSLAPEALWDAVGARVATIARSPADS